MLHEEECVLLKEANIEDPLADPFHEEMSGDAFESDKIQKNVSSESESDINDQSEESSNKLESDFDINKGQDLSETCDICMRRFKNKKGLLGHKQAMHNPNKKVKRRKYRKNNFTEKQFKCKICVYCTLNKTNFLTHMKKHQRHDEKFLSSEEFQVRCELCMAPLRSAAKLSKHMTTAHPKEKCSCGVCFEKFKARSALRRHLKNFHPEEAPIFIKDMDDELERERAIRKETQPERNKQRRLERMELKAAQRREKKMLLKIERKNREKLAKLEKKEQNRLERMRQRNDREKLAKLEKNEQNRLAKMTQRNNEDLAIVKEEPEELMPVRISRRNNAKEVELQQIQIEIKQEPEIEITEIIKEIS